MAPSASKLKKLKAALDCCVVDVQEYSADPHAIAGGRPPPRSKVLPWAAEAHGEGVSVEGMWSHDTMWLPTCFRCVLSGLGFKPGCSGPLKKVLPNVPREDKVLVGNKRGKRA